MDKVDLPTNRSFGLLFSFCFLALGIYFFISNHPTLGVICSGTAVGLIIVTLTKAELLSPLNKFWMGLGRSEDGLTVPSRGSVGAFRTVCEG